MNLYILQGRHLHRIGPIVLVKQLDGAPTTMIVLQSSLIQHNCNNINKEENKLSKIQQNHFARRHRLDPRGKTKYIWARALV